MKKRVVAYCRVSTKSDDQENSFDNQKSYFQREIRNNADYEYCGIYADRGISGTTLEKRPDFNRMLTDAGLDIENGYKVIAEPKFDLIVTKNTSRFARNVSVDVILKALARNKVYVSFLDLNKTTENTEDITYIQIFATFDERDSRDKSKKTSFGMRESAKSKNTILCNSKIHGYDYDTVNNALKANPKYAPHIKRMYEMYVDGIGAYRIAKIFYEEGILNKSGKHYREDTIRGILANEKYYGMVTRMKYDTGVVFNKHYPHKREEEDQVRFMSDRVEPIISQELFDKAQEIRLSRIQSSKQIGLSRSDKGVNYGTSPYGYKVFCAACNKQYRAQATRKQGNWTERYYSCVGKQNVDRSQRCKSPNVSETFLNNELKSEKYTEMLAASFMVAVKFLFQLMADITAAIRDKSANEELARLGAIQREYQAKIDKGVELYLDGTIDKMSVEKQLAPVRQENEQVTARIDEIRKPKEEKIQDVIRIRESILELMSRIDEMYDLGATSSDTATKNELTRSGIFSGKTPKKQFTQGEILKDIKRIMVHSDKSIVVEFKTFAELEQLVNRHEHIMTDKTLAIYNELKASGWNIEVGWKIIGDDNMAKLMYEFFVNFENNA